MNKSGCCPCKMCANSALLPSFPPSFPVTVSRPCENGRTWNNVGRLTCSIPWATLVQAKRGDSPRKLRAFTPHCCVPEGPRERQKERENRVPSCWELSNSPHGQTAGLVAHKRRSAPVRLAMDARRACLRPSENCTFLGRLRQSRFQAALAGRTGPSEPSYGTTPTHAVLPGTGSCSTWRLFPWNRPLTFSRNWCILVLFSPQVYFTRDFFF